MEEEWTGVNEEKEGNETLLLGTVRRMTTRRMRERMEEGKMMGMQQSDRRRARPRGGEGERGRLSYEITAEREGRGREREREMRVTESRGGRRDLKSRSLFLFTTSHRSQLLLFNRSLCFLHTFVRLTCQDAAINLPSKKLFLPLPPSFRFLLLPLDVSVFHHDQVRCYHILLLLELVLFALSCCFNTSSFTFRSSASSCLNRCSSSFH